MTLADGWRGLTGFFSHPAPRVALVGTVALIVVGNQPFYPFYVWVAVGAPVPAAFLTFLSTPVFAGAPALARRDAGLGRAVFLLAAIGNTALSTVALGPASGVELFYVPSLLVAWAAFPPGARARPLRLSGAAALAGLIVGRRVPPLARLDGDQAHALLVMHAVSVACLTAIIAYRAWRIARSEAAQPNRASA